MSEYRNPFYDKFLDMDGTGLDMEVTRTRDDPGVSFSSEAMNQLDLQMMTWVGTRIMRRWMATNEPPTVVRVSIEVEVG